MVYRSGSPYTNIIKFKFLPPFLILTIWKENIRVVIKIFFISTIQFWNKAFLLCAYVACHLCPVMHPAVLLQDSHPWRRLPTAQVDLVQTVG
jgi:hypothetical protein